MNCKNKLFLFRVTQGENQVTGSPGHGAPHWEVTQEQEWAAMDREGGWRLLKLALASRRGIGEIAVSQSWWFNRTNTIHRMGIFQPYIYAVSEPPVLRGDKHAGWYRLMHTNADSLNQCRVPPLLVHERNWLLENGRNPHSEPQTLQNISS